MKPSYRCAAGDKAHAAGYQRSVIDQKGKKSDCEAYVTTGIWPTAWGEPKPITRKARSRQKDTAPSFMEVSLFHRKTDSKATPRTILSKSDFLKMFSRHDVRAKKDGKLFSPATFNGSRKNENFVAATGLAIDSDNGFVAVSDVTGLFPGVVIAYYTTHSHQPDAPRLRFVVPFSRQIDAEEHALLVRGVKSVIPSELMGCIDQTCFQRARAHYLPSCPPENEKYAVAGHQDGDPLDVDHFIRLGRELEPPAAEQTSITPPEPAEAEPPTTFEVTDPATGEVIDLTVWAAQNPTFDLIAAIDPQYFRNNPNDGKQHIQCPFEDSHTDQEDDLATFAANASPPQYEAWDIHCCHAHCVDRDRLEFIQTMLEKGWISFGQIRVNAPPVVELRRPLFVSYQVNEIMAAPEWSTLRPDERRIALDLMTMMWAEIGGMVADDNWMIARRLGLSEKEWMSYREILTRTGWLIECNGRLTNGITKREFDNAQSAYMRSIISGAMGGRKAAENRKRK